MTRLRPLMGNALASVADQAATSGTNFAVNVLLARWLTGVEYGGFSVAWSVCLIFAALHNALILEPMTVVGPAEFGSRLSGYIQSVTKLNWRVVLPLGLAAASTAVFYRQLVVRDALALLGLALPGYLLLLTSRREQYILNAPCRALLLSLIYAAAYGGLLTALHELSALSSRTAVLSMGVALPIALVALARRDLPPNWQPPAENLRDIAAAHWTYGKWLVGAAILGVGVPDLQIILLSAMVDLKSAGALRALMNFILPLSQLLTALSVFALPKLARRMKQTGIGRGLRQALVYPVGVVALALGYVLLLLLLGSWLERLLYGGRMAIYLDYLPLLAMAAFVSAIGAGFTTILRAAQNSFHILTAGVAATFVGLTASFLLLKPYGLRGALISLILANSASALLIVATYVWTIRKEPASSPAGAGRIFAIFDENLIETSPVGSCLLKVVEDIAGEYPLHVFYNRLAWKGAGVRKTWIPLPRGPVILRSILFTAFCAAACLFTDRGERQFRIAAQGVFPSCDLSYAQFCHRIFLRDHRGSLGGGFLRRTARLMTHLWGSLTERKAFQSARVIVVPSEGLARELNAAYPAIVRGKIKVIPNPVDTERYRKPEDFSRDIIRGDLGCAQEELLLSFCALGNFERKGLRVALEALAELNSPGVMLAVVGGSPGEIRDYEKIGAELGVGQRVRFAGMQQDIRPYLWSSDAFIFPSSYEAFPLVCLQAAAAGLPLITTRVYGVEEFMLDGATGWLIERDAKSVASAVARAMHDHLQTAAMGQTARERVAAYDDKTFRARWRTLLQECDAS